MEALRQKSDDLELMVSNQFDMLQMITGVIRQTSDCLKEHGARINVLEKDMPQILAIHEAQSQTIGTLLERCSSVEADLKVKFDQLEKRQKTLEEIVKNMCDENVELRKKLESRAEKNNDASGSLWFIVLLVSLGWIIVQH